MNNILREIQLEGSFNFRDLGGYETVDGRNVKRGMLFRSGNLSRVTEKDIEMINQLGIGKICDLRGLDEIEKFPDPILDGAIWSHTPLVSDEKMVRQVGDLADFEHALINSKPGELLISLNQAMVTYKNAFQNVFKILLTEPHTPMLFHCMAGKDRTGTVAALILSVLGVPRPLIEEDYLYTNNTLEQMKANFADIGFNDLPHIDKEVLDAMFEARAEYIHAFFNELENKYGSIDSYFKDVIGLTDDEINLLKSHLLE
jgi:protein-tyrosine phosphatase